MINSIQLAMVSGSWVLLHSRPALHDSEVMVIRDNVKKFDYANG